MLRALARYVRIALPRAPLPAELATHGPVFERWARPWVILFVAVTAVVYGGVLLVALWPLDSFLITDEGDRATFGALRLTNAVIAVVALLGLLVRPIRAQASTWAGLVLLGYAAGGAYHASGLPHDPFYWPGMFAPLATIALVVPLIERVAWTTAIAVLHHVVWFFRHPESLDGPETPGSLGVYANAMILSIGLGHVLYLFAWLIFRDRLRQRAMAAELAGWNDRLRSQVEARTAELRALARRVEQVHEDERRRLAHELHDELGQSLTALRLEVAVLGRHGLSRAQRDALDGRLDELLEAVQWTVSSLRPKPLEEQGLVPACEWLLTRFATQTGLDVESSLDETVAPPAPTSLAVFRVLQEALTNVSKHAEASAVTASLRRDADSIVLEIADDGVGLSTSARAEAGGHGMLGMRERAFAIGGALEVEPEHVGADGQRAGVRVRLRVPRGAVNEESSPGVREPVRVSP